MCNGGKGTAIMYVVLCALLKPRGSTRCVAYFISCILAEALTGPDSSLHCLCTYVRLLQLRPLRKTCICPRVDGRVSSAVCGCIAVSSVCRCGLRMCLLLPEYGRRNHQPVCVMTSSDNCHRTSGHCTSYLPNPLVSGAWRSWCSAQFSPERSSLCFHLRRMR